MADVAVAVSPRAERWQKIVGRKASLPVIERPIPIIADDYVKMEFGAGALKVTPGHDKNDFEIGRRHGLDVVSVVNLDGTINENGGPYAGMDRFAGAFLPIMGKARFSGRLRRDRDFLALVEFLYRTVAQGLVHGFLDLRAGAFQEPLAIAKRLALWVLAPVDEVK